MEAKHNSWLSRGVAIMGWPEICSTVGYNSGLNEPDSVAALSELRMFRFLRGGPRDASHSGLNFELLCGNSPESFWGKGLEGWSVVFYL